MLNNKVTTDTYTQLCHLWVIVVNLTRTHARTHTRSPVHSGLPSVSLPSFPVHTTLALPLVNLSRIGTEAQISPVLY